MKKRLAAVALMVAACGPGQERKGHPAPAFAVLMDSANWVTWETADFTLRHPAGAVVVADTDPATGFIGTAVTWPSAHLRFAVSYVSAFADGAPALDPAPSARVSCDKSSVDFAPLAGPCLLRSSHYEAFELSRNCGRDCIAHEIHVRLPHHLLMVTFNRKQGLSYSLPEQLTLYRTILATLREPSPQATR